MFFSEILGILCSRNLCSRGRDWNELQFMMISPEAAPHPPPFHELPASRTCNASQHWSGFLFSPRVLFRMMKKDATLERSTRTDPQPLGSADPHPRNSAAGEDQTIDQLPFLEWFASSSTLQCAGAAESVHVQVDTNFGL